MATATNSTPPRDEEWRSILGWEGLYEASSRGLIRSLDRVVRHRNRWGGESDYRRPGRVMAPQLNKARGGYLQLVLFREGQAIGAYVHTLVCLAFHGLRPDGYQAAHVDGKKVNCCAENLVWKTILDNDADKDLHGTRNSGSRHGLAKLTEADVRAIRAVDGLSHAKIGRLFGVSGSTIDDIRSGRRWKHVL